MVLTFQIAFSISLGSRTFVLTALSATQINIFIIPRNDPVLRAYVAVSFVTSRQFSVAANAPLLEVTDSSAVSGRQNTYYIRGQFHSGGFTSETHAGMWPLPGNRKWA